MARLRRLDGDGYENAAGAGGELAVEDVRQLVLVTAENLGGTTDP